MLEWVAYLFCRSLRPRNRTGVSCIAGGFFTTWAIRETHLQSTNTQYIVFIFMLFSCQVVSGSFCNPMDCSPPGSSVHGISQARILEWVAISFSRKSSQPRDWTHISHPHLNSYPYLKVLHKILSHKRSRVGYLYLSKGAQLSKFVYIHIVNYYVMLKRGWYCTSYYT